MRNIILVEIASTGVNYVRDVINRNYTPVGLRLKNEDSESTQEYKQLVDECLNSIEEDFELIHEKDTYEETLQMVREYDPLLVIPASEKGVILATKLANDLNLKSNPIENIDSLTFKDKMQEKIGEKGLRHIRGRRIRSVQEAIDFYDEEGLNEVVVKPTYSSGSVGVRICLNKQEMIDSLTVLFNDVNLYGEKNNEYVVQEFINGEEYIVNTVSCEGVHRVTTIWKYNKIRTSEGGQIYNYMNSINELGLGESDIVEYAYKVCDALGIQYGPVHGEFMVDEKGPVLIEVNCRPMGGGMDAEFLDRVSGQHETDSGLDSYINPDKFSFELKRGYNLYEHGALKFFIIPDDITARSSPMNKIGINLKSFYTASLYSIVDSKPFVKTQDLETTAGTVFLTHPDGYVVMKDLDFLNSIERRAFQLVLSDGSKKKTSIDDNEDYSDLKSILDIIPSYGNTFFVTDQFFDDVDLLQVNPNEIDEVRGKFDCVVVNLNESVIGKTDEEITGLFLNIINKVKVGGLIFIPKSTYQFIPNGRIGAEALVKVLDLKLQLPLHRLMGFVIASKR